MGDNKDEKNGVRIDSSTLPPNVDLGLAEGTPRSAKESPLRSYERIFEAFPDCTFVIDLDHQIKAVNQQFKLITGYSENEVIGKQLSEFIRLDLINDKNGDSEEKTIDRYVVRTVLEGQKPFDYKFHIISKKGNEIPINFSGTPIFNEDGNIVGIVGVGRDMSELKKVREELIRAQEQIREYDRKLEDQLGDQYKEVRQRAKMLEELSFTDELTKLYNRRFLFRRLNEEIHRSNRYGTPFSCVILDIDFFKKINDTYGHIAGDMVLYELAAILRGSVRNADVVSRTGGEEFVILLPGVREGHALLFCERLREKVKNFQFTYLPKGINMTVSMGITDYPREGLEDTDDIIKLADDALYKAKETRDATVSSSNLSEADMEKAAELNRGAARAKERE